MKPRVSINTTVVILWYNQTSGSSKGTREICIARLPHVSSRGHMTRRQRHDGKYPAWCPQSRPTCCEECPCIWSSSPPVRGSRVGTGKRPRTPRSPAVLSWWDQWISCAEAAAARRPSLLDKVTMKWITSRSNHHQRPSHMIPSTDEWGSSLTGGGSNPCIRIYLSNRKYPQARWWVSAGGKTFFLS